MTDTQLQNPIMTGNAKFIFKPVFNKVNRVKGGPIHLTGLSTNKYLRGLVSMSNHIDQLTVNTLIYNPYKDFLVNLVNERNSIISQKLKENVKTIRILCDMDRRFRAREIKKTKSVLIKNRNVINKATSVEPEIATECDNLSQEDEKIVYVVNPGQYYAPIENEKLVYLINSGHKFKQLEINNLEPNIETDLNDSHLSIHECTEQTNIKSYSGLSDIDMETLYCYYGDNEFSIENIKPSMVNHNEVSAVVKTLMTESIYKSETTNSYTVSKAFNEVVVSTIPVNETPESFIDSEFYRLEAANEQFCNINTKASK